MRRRSITGTMRRMRRTAYIHRALFAAVLITGLACSAVRDGVSPIAKVEGWAPSAMAAFGDDQPFAVAEIALDRGSAEKAWRETVGEDLERRIGEPREPGLYGSLDAVDFDSHAVVVWSSGESGVCPGWLADIDSEGATVHIETEEHIPGNGCTDDYNPYAMVVAVPRDRLPDPSLLPTAEVIVDGRSHGLESVVDVYPARGWPNRPPRH